MHFDARADVYAEARPRYPAALWERLRGRGLLNPGATALDLGAGTGQATGPLIEAGLHVTAVEPGARLARILRVAYPTARVLVSRAEDLEIPDDEFDLAVAATSIHWMDLGVVLPKVHSVLKNDGRFLVWRHVFGDPEGRRTPFRDRVAEIVDSRSTATRAHQQAEDLDATADRLTDSGLFHVEDAATFPWSIELNADQIGRLFATFSDWSDLEVREAAAAVDELGGTVVEHYSSWLLVLVPTQRGGGRS